MCGELLERDGEPMAAHDGRVNTLSDLAQLLQRRIDLVSRPRKLGCRAAVADELLLEQAQLERERHQAMLRTVVEVALQSLPLALAGLHNPGPGATQFVHSSSQLDVQPRVLQR